VTDLGTLLSRAALRGLFAGALLVLWLLRRLCPRLGPLLLVLDRDPRDLPTDLRAAAITAAPYEGHGETDPLAVARTLQRLWLALGRGG
jgi:hypothetical protein